MRKRLTITFDSAPARLPLHEIQNFGEELYLHFRNGKQARLDIDAVDQWSGKIEVLVLRKPQAIRVLRETEQMLAKHHLDAIATIRVDEIEA